MKSLIKNLKGLIPYLFLIAIYFFFINIEAKKNHNRVPNSGNIIKMTENLKLGESENKESSVRQSIPVIPFIQ